LMPIDDRDWYKGNRSWHRKRKIKGIMKATIKAVVVILIIGLGTSTALAYASIEPFATYKNVVSSKAATLIPDKAQETITPDKHPKLAKVVQITPYLLHSYKDPVFTVELEPTSLAVANKIYIVEIYEKGRLRARTTISWNQPELNVFTHKYAYFRLTNEEWDAYSWKDVKHLFTLEFK